jgi:hypothetical protein
MAQRPSPGQWHEQMGKQQDDLAEMLGAIAVHFGNRSRAVPMFSLNLMPEDSSAVAAACLGSSRKNVAAGSQRFVFAGFRRRTPGPPPLYRGKGRPTICFAVDRASRQAFAAEVHRGRRGGRIYRLLHRQGRAEGYRDGLMDGARVTFDVGKFAGKECAQNLALRRDR